MKRKLNTALILGAMGGSAIGFLIWVFVTYA